MNQNRKFDGMLFHGMGEDSAILQDVLINRLIAGHNYFGGMQQGVCIHSPEYKRGEEFIKDVCRDILASFGFSDEGLKWEKLPYPGTLIQSTIDEAREMSNKTTCTCEYKMIPGQIISHWCWKCDDWKNYKK